MKYFSFFRFDVDEGTLWRGPEQIPLTRKAGALLSCLLAGAGSWVSKSAIMSAVWPDTHVQPDNVKVLVREIRQALGDHPRVPTFIRSAPGRGYAFIASVSEGDRAGVADEPFGPRAPIFVNRGPELAALADALDAARASARRLVLVSGEHGVGKTALCDAFIRTAAVAGPARVCYGQCFDRESPQESYYPFFDALLRLDRRHPGFVASILAQHAPSWLAQFPQWAGVRTPSADPVRMLDELSDAVDAISHDLPLVIVLEDLQWADADTLHALARLAGSHVPSKLLVVGTYCDVEWAAGARAKHRVTSSMTASARSVRVVLEPLTVEHVVRYVDARFGPECLSDLAPAVHRATGGNPFMIVNAFDSLVVRGLVTEGGDGWRREASLETIAKALPETLVEAVARQLDQLDMREREVLEAAAVVGLEFSSMSVAFALRARMEDVRSVLDPLARRGQLIVATRAAGSPRPSQGTYRFRNALQADVIARRAPMLRQLRVAQRLASVRETEVRRA